MGILAKLTNLAVSLERKNNSIFTYPVKKQKEYISKFQNPKDDIERSYFQYCCQMKLNNPAINILLNLASLPMLVLYYKKGCTKIDEKRNVDAVFFADGKPENIIPVTLKEQFEHWSIVTDKGEFLSKTDKGYIKMLMHRYPFSWHFLLKCLIKIRFYSYEIIAKKPKAIVACSEYSFTSSILTDYCNMHKIEHINVMHGEKLYYIRDSFFHFNRCYVWNQYYRDLLCELRAESSQFQIAIPLSLKFETKTLTEKKFDYTYYLGAEKDEHLEKIVYCMNTLEQRGYRVSIRLHPRYSDKNKLLRLCKGNIFIEDGNDLSIEDSILQTWNAISCYSTVLNQAYHNGVDIVIDDVSDTETFEKLSELGYVMLKVRHKLLSQILEDIE